MTSPLRLGMWVAATIALVACLALAVSDDAIDFFVEGDEDPWYVEAGRYEGTWQFEGDPRELAEFARGLERIEFRLVDPAPGSWKDKKAPEATAFSARDSLAIRGAGTLVVAGQKHPFRLGTANVRGTWLQFGERLPFLTERSYGDGFEISLEAQRNPANDWLYLWLGPNPDGSSWGLPYTRME